MKKLPRRLLSSRFQRRDAGSEVATPRQGEIETVRASLASGQYRLEETFCPCGIRGGVVIAETDRYGLPLDSVVCSECGTLRFNPYLDAESLDKFYRDAYQQMYKRTNDPERYWSRQLSYGEKILATCSLFLSPGDTVLEVGCGAGGAVKIFQDAGYRAAGCDFSEQLIRRGCERGVANLHAGSFTEVAKHFNGDKFKLIYLHHVFEHLSDPLDFLHQCREHLTEAGEVIVIVPDFSRIDLSPFPAGNLLPFLHIGHKFNFTFEGLRRLANLAGFSASPLKVPIGMRTAWAHMPELWVRMTVRQGEATAELPAAREGEKVFRYLQRTERLFQFGLCPAQLSARWKSLRHFSLRAVWRRARS